MKGQLTQAHRLNAATVVVAKSDGTFEVRRRGEEDRTVSALDDV
jgi:tellurite resistance protein